MILSDIRGRIFSRLEWSTSDPQAVAAGNAAINEGQRLLAFLTLSLETTRQFRLTPGVSFYRMLDQGWADWLVPLRVRLSNDTTVGVDNEFDTQEADTAMFDQQQNPSLVTTAAPKLRPSSLYEMAAEDSGFLYTQGTPSEYGCIGWDLLFLNRRPTLQGQTLLITYGRSSSPLVNDGDVPEIHGSDHNALIEYGEWRLRCNEGGQELQSASPALTAFLDIAASRAKQVRARSLAQRYDRQPFELEDLDYSRIIKSRSDLIPYRKEDRWTGQP